MNYGAEKKTYTTNVFGFGALSELPDGRRFRFASNADSLVSAGNPFQAPILIANHRDLAVLQTLANRRYIQVTLGATDMGANQYKDGYAAVHEPDLAGAGHIYALDAHNSASASTAATLSLKPNQYVAETLVAGSATIDLIPNPYSGVIALSPSETYGTSFIIGYAAAYHLVANDFGWYQTRGIACVIGPPVTDAQVIVPGASEIYATVFLTLE